MENSNNTHNEHIDEKSLIDKDAVLQHENLEGLNQEHADNSNKIIHELENQLHTSVNENKILHEEIKELKYTNHTLGEEKEKLHVEIKHLHENFSHEKDKLTLEIQNLEGQLSKYKEDIDNLTENKKALHKEFISKQEEFEVQQIKKMKEEIDTIYNTILSNITGLFDQTINNKITIFNEALTEKIEKKILHSHSVISNLNEKLKKLKEQKITLEKNNLDHLQKLKDLESLLATQATEFKTQIENLTHEKETLIHEKESLINEKENLIIGKEVLTKEYTTKSNEDQNQIQQSKIEIDRLNKELLESNNRYQNLELMLQANHGKEEIIKNLEKELHDLQEKINNNEQINKNLQNEISKKTEVINELQHQIQALNESIQQNNTKYQDALTRLNLTSSEQQQRISDLLKEAKDLNITYTSTKEDLDKLKIEYQDLDKAYKQAKEEIVRLKEDHEGLHSAHNASKNDMVKLKEENDKILMSKEEEIKGNMELINTLNDKVNNLEKEIIKLSDIVKDKDNELKELTLTTQAKSNEIKDSYELKTKENESLLNKQSITIDKLDKEINDLKDTINNQKKYQEQSDQNYQEKYSLLQEDIESKIKQIESLKNEINVIKSDKEVISKKNNELKDEIKHLANKNEESTVEYESKLGNLQQEYTNLKDEYEKLRILKERINEEILKDNKDINSIDQTFNCMKEVSEHNRMIELENEKLRSRIKILEDDNKLKERQLVELMEKKANAKDKTLFDSKLDIDLSIIKALAEDHEEIRPPENNHKDQQHPVPPLHSNLDSVNRNQGGRLNNQDNAHNDGSNFPKSNINDYEKIRTENGMLKRSNHEFMITNQKLSEDLQDAMTNEQRLVQQIQILKKELELDRDKSNSQEYSMQHIKLMLFKFFDAYFKPEHNNPTTREAIDSLKIICSMIECTEKEKNDLINLFNKKHEKKKSILKFF